MQGEFGFSPLLSEIYMFSSLEHRLLKCAFRYCGSPISGMGTTLALTGAYNLAGALKAHPDNHEAAFTLYESTMRPVVERAQKLAPGAPNVFNPETWWGVWTLRAFVGFVYWSGLSTLVFKFVGPPANEVPVEDYGFPRLEEWRG